MAELKATKKSILIGGIFFSVIILLLAISTPQLFNNSNLYTENTIFLSRLKTWLCLFLIYIYSVKVEKRNFLLWTEQKYSFLFYLKSTTKILLTLILVMLIVSYLLKISGANTYSQKMEEIVQVLRKNKLLLLFTCLTAGITEELIFRGYIIPRLELLLKTTYFPIIISSVLFGFLHFSYGNYAQIIGPLFIGLVFAIHYNKYRNIKMIIGCHFLWDLVVLLSKTA